MGDSREALSAFPDEVKTVLGYGLYLAQTGDRHPNAKPMKGFKGASVMQISYAYDGMAYRVAYSPDVNGCVAVLHAYEKKSKQGSVTPRRDMDLIKKRFGDALAPAQPDQGRKPK